MATIKNITSDTLLSGTSGNDSIQNGGWLYGSSYDGGSNVTINTGAGNDEVDNYEGSNVTINTGAGNDSIYNTGDSVTINTGAGNDDVYNEGLNVTINTTEGNDDVGNNGESVTINTGAGNDYVFNHGSDVTINTGAGNDYVWNSGNSVTINTGAGDDYVLNYGNTGAGNDYVLNYGSSNVTINTGAGDDSVYNSYDEDYYCKNVVFQYSSGDGNDIIYGFREDSTLQIGGTYSTKTSGDDIIVTVGKGKISLIGAASLDTVNIVSDENPATKWKLDGTTATYGDLVIKGVKSLDGISLNGSTVTISKASLGTSKVTISKGYTLALADDVDNATTKTAWSISGTKATYKQTKTDGYTLADNVITYTKKATKILTTVSGVKSTKGLSVDGKVVTVSKASLGTSKVTISKGYTLALADDVNNATTKTAWSLSGTKATYKQTTTAGYTLADNVITYTKKATKTLTTVSGVKSTNGLSVDGKVVTVSKASLGTSKVTISKGYTLALADDVSESTAKQSWSLSGTKATYKQTTTAGYTLANNAITYTKKSSKTLASVKGAKSTSGLKVSGQKITLKNSALNKKVTISGGYEFDFQSDYKNATITGSKDSDTITTRGKNISINGGTGDDTIKILGTGTITGGSGADIFVLKSNATNLISDYEQVDKISLTSGAANVTTSGNDIIFNEKITLSGAADKTVTYIAGGVEKIYENTPDDIIYNAKGISATLTADYSGDSFTADSKLVTIDASPVMNQLKIIGNKKMNVIIGTGDDDYISGELGADTIQGGNGNDSLVGGAGNDCLIGGAGDDSLWGGSGTDTLIGGDGADIFIYKAGDGTIVIDDFDGSLDKIFVLSNKDKVENPIAYKSGNVTFEVGDGQIVVNGGADKYIPIYNAAKNILVKYNP